MRITAKIAAGYGILIVLILAALSYQLSLFHLMISVNRNLSEINFRAAIQSLQLLRDLEQVEEFTRKFFTRGGDPGYGSRLKEMRNDFAQSLQELQKLRLSAQENEEIAQVSRLWREFAEISTSQETELSSLNKRQAEAALSRQLELLSQLRMQTQNVIRATRHAIESQVSESARTGELAEKISWGAAAAALLLSLVASLWIISSISEPLKNLTEGTRAVTEGQLFYQLDSSGKDELAQLARDFNTMTRRLSELDQMKKDFVSHVSHELKTPLASIREVIRLLLDEIPGPLSEQQRRFLEVNLQSCDRLSSMIGNLLDVSRMEAGVMEYDWAEHDLATLLRVVLAEFEVPVRKKGIGIEADLPPKAVTVRCDADRIVQVFGNLLGNAMKFCPSGSTIRVSLQRTEEIPASVPERWRRKIPGHASRNEFVAVSVADSGPGIPDLEKERIFEKFHRLGRAKDTGQGVGLGLAISRTIIEAHGGAIWVEDNTGGGSVFHVLLATMAAAQDSPAVLSRTEGGNPHGATAPDV